MYTWEQIVEIVKYGGYFERSDAVELAYSKVSDADRKKFITDMRRRIAEDRKCDGVIYTKNPYPYDFEPGIHHYTAWYIDRKNLHTDDFWHVRMCPYDGNWPLVPHDVIRFTNKSDDMSIPEINHFHLFFREKRRELVKPQMPLYFAHFTRFSALAGMLSTKIGHSTGFMVPKGETEQFRAVYFRPIFDPNKHDLATEDFSNAQTGVCLIMSSNAVYATANWHYNFGDFSGDVRERHTVRNPSEIGTYGGSEDPELVMHDVVSLENICAIVTNYEPLLRKTSVMGIPVLAQMPSRAPGGRMFNFVENMPIDTPVAEREKRTIAHFTI